jgi:hypothetical protein
LIFPKKQAFGLMPDDIFISYSSRDLLIAEAIRKSLVDQGVSCWMAFEGWVSGTARIPLALRCGRRPHR